MNLNGIDSKNEFEGFLEKRIENNPSQFYFFIMSFLSNLAVVSIGGEGQLKNYLRAWIELLNYAPLEYLVLLDKHSEKLMPDLIRELGIEINKFILLEKRK